MPNKIVRVRFGATVEIEMSEERCSDAEMCAREWLIQNIEKGPVQLAYGGAALRIEKVEVGRDV